MKILLLILLSFNFSITLLVPDEYPTIQSAIDVSSDNDEILVSSGIYNENINFGSKKISVIGEDKQSTIIDGNYSGSVVIFDGSGLSEALLSGFTITHGSAYDGGGIYCSSSSPIIQDNIITENISETYGGGISCNYSSANILNNIITQNSALYGGGISFDRYTSSTIQGNTIIDNYAQDGGGIGCFIFSSPLITNNTISNNSAEEAGGGIYCYYGSSAIINNTIIWDNNAFIGPNISVYSSNPIITYSDIMDEWAGEGNLSENPEFNDDYTLQSSSPCIDTGDPNSELDPDATRADMGAHYFHQTILGDINNDGITNILDVIIVINIILNNEYDINVDLNQDNIINIQDIILLVNIILN